MSAISIRLWVALLTDSPFHANAFRKIYYVKFEYSRRFIAACYSISTLSLQEFPLRLKVLRTLHLRFAIPILFLFAIAIALLLLNISRLPLRDHCALSVMECFF